MEQTFDLYRDIAERTDGDVYIGVVGPVRTGKSTLISRMMEELVLNGMTPGPKRDRIADELPQSGSGKTIMTTQPKFVPSEAVSRFPRRSGHRARAHGGQRGLFGRGRFGHRGGWHRPHGAYPLVRL